MTTTIDTTTGSVDLVATAEERAQLQQHTRGKLTARERITALLDAGTFVEFGATRRPFGAPRGSDEVTAVVTGIGEIDGRPVACYSQDFSVRGGTLGSIEGEKICSLMDRAIALRIPIVAIVDSGGARIQEGVRGLNQYGRIFKRTVAASGVVPQISIIIGPCAGGAVYCPALTDVVIMVKGKSHMFVTGPAVVKAVTGEAVSAEELGGSSLHSTTSGVAHYEAEDEDDAFDYARVILGYLPSRCEDKPPSFLPARPEPEFGSPTDLTRIVPQDPKIPYDIVDLIEAIVDDSEFVQLSEKYAENIVTGFACIDGLPVGIVANQPLVDAGTIDGKASEKAARFIRTCDAFGLPIVSLVDVPGYLPGAEQEEQGIIRRGAKLIVSYAMATVPLITVIVRKAFGGAFIVMSSKALGADYVCTWPNAEIAVMGDDAAVGIIHRKALAGINDEVERHVTRERLREEYREQVMGSDEAIQIGAVDAVISPADTRDAVCAALRTHKSKSFHPYEMRKHDNAPQ
ncbi:MAG: acyl-CoA carboxylase subunit beta [Corynebacterium pyruviciproducens]|uniref:acyl-CoA carboxylase subunit beta n=1 Tax=Corynebacterium pyruviciproducens TaxID=598660 RepID=UPI00398367C9